VRQQRVQRLRAGRRGSVQRTTTSWRGWRSALAQAAGGGAGDAVPGTAEPGRPLVQDDEPARFVGGAGPVKTGEYSAYPGWRPGCPAALFSASLKAFDELIEDPFTPA
jgi:hypothetical protein